MDGAEASVVFNSVTFPEQKGNLGYLLASGAMHCLEPLLPPSPPPPILGTHGPMPEFGMLPILCRIEPVLILGHAHSTSCTDLTWILLYLRMFQYASEAVPFLHTLPRSRVATSTWN